ncbi:MAG: DUF1127 domain-containing protein [Rubellimicrobium sp.]|nr:DUF1127 domain-containing protein [Rubellimicrobium sp.]
MTTIDTTRIHDAAGLRARITGMVLGFAHSVQDWNDARITRNMLSRLSARELDDIGLCRGDIDLIAAGKTR